MDESKKGLDENNGIFNYERLEVISGFLCHLAMTFEIVFPYLKGFHLSLAQYLPGRNAEGWKLEDDEWNAYVQDKIHDGVLSNQEAEDLLKRDCTENHPHQIKVVPLFHKCLDSLLKFFASPTPPLIVDRSLTLYLVLYGYVDAPKQGFGATIST